MKPGFKTFENFREHAIEGFEIEDDHQQENKSLQIPLRLPDHVIKLIESRIGGEYNAHYAYRAAANWCKNANYKKAASFFDKGADEELDHAKDLQNYLTQWNILPKIPASNTHFGFNDLPQIIGEIYKIEYGLLDDYTQSALSVFETHTATFNFFQKYIDIQNASVAEFSDLLNGLELINKENKLDLLFFEERYF